MCIPIQTKSLAVHFLSIDKSPIFTVVQVDDAMIFPHYPCLVFLIGLHLTYSRVPRWWYPLFIILYFFHLISGATNSPWFGGEHSTNYDSLRSPTSIATNFSLGDGLRTDRHKWRVITF